MRSPAGWETIRSGSAAYIYPVADSLPHNIESRDCACGSFVEPVIRDGKVFKLVVHNAWDGRE